MIYGPKLGLQERELGEKLMARATLAASLLVFSFASLAGVQAADASKTKVKSVAVKRHGSIKPRAAAAGPAGPQGKTGPAGPAGAVCPAGPAGPQGISGRD